MRLEGKVCVITGAGSGIGRATALLFAREGARTVVADVNEPGGQETTRLIREAGGEARAIGIDVTSSRSVQAALQQAVDTYGRLDVLVNNAGYGVAATVEQMEEAEWDRLMAVNLKGVFLGCKYAIPIMRRFGGGVIVNTASVVAMIGVRNRAAYCASKGGVLALTRAMALDYAAEGIRVNCVAPGTIETPFFTEILDHHVDPRGFRKEMEERQPLGRLGRPDEIAQAILYLASGESSFVTGSALVVDGGWTAQ